MELLHPDSKFSQIMGTVFDYLKLSVLLLVFSLPVITAGAAATGAMCVGMQIARGEAPKLWAPFWRSFRQNFRQATLATLVLLAIAGLLGFDWYILFQLDSSLAVRAARAVVFVAAMVVLLAALYLFPVLARFQVTGRQLVRNAVSFGLMYLPGNLLVLGCILAGLWLLDHALPLLPVIVAVWPAIVLFLMSRICVRHFANMEVQYGKNPV